MIRTDDIDRTILDLLQKDGRMTNVELAAKVGLSPPPCLRRLKYLERSKIIVGYKVLINRHILGYTLNALLIVKLNTQRLEIVTMFTQNILKFPTVLSCYSTLGNSELIISIISENIDTYEEFLNEYIQGDPHVVTFSSRIIVRSFKNGDFIINNEEQ